MNCKMGLNCKDMGEQTLGRCQNQKACDANAQTIYGKNNPWIEAIASIQGIQLYCLICQAYTFVKNEAMFSDCRHIQYIESLDCWGGCGWSGNSLNLSYKDAIQKLHPAILNQIQNYLKDKNIYGLRLLEINLQHGNGTKTDLELAVAWLSSLQGTTLNAITQTLAWITSDDYAIAQAHELTTNNVLS